MKLVGFLREYDSFAAVNLSLKDIRNPTPTDPLLVNKVILYLKQGREFEGLMDWVSDVEDESIELGYTAYFTDGTWIWPMYFTYYLTKFNDYKIPEEFANYLMDRDFIFPSLTNEDEKRVSDYFFDNIWGT